MDTTKKFFGIQLDLENNSAIGSIVNNDSIQVFRNQTKRNYKDRYGAVPPWIPYSNYKAPLCMSIVGYDVKLFGDEAKLYKYLHPESTFIGKCFSQNSFGAFLNITFTY